MKHRFAYYLHPERYTNVLYQLAFITITSIILSVHLYRFVTEFHPAQHSPQIKDITPALTASWTQKPERVSVGLHVADFLRFDTVKNEFIINAFIWFLFDADKLPLTTIDKFSFTKGEFLQKSEPIIKKVGKLTQALYTIRVQFSTILNYARFPLDDHRIFLNLTNPLLSAEQLVYTADVNNYIVSENLFISGWDIVGKSVTSGYSPISLGNEHTLLQPKTVFSLDLSKGDLRQLSLIFLPLLFLFFLGLFTLSIRDISVAMTLPLASVSGLLAYSFVIQTLAPAVGYMMLSDHLFFFFLCSTFVILLIKALGVLPEHIVSQRNIKKIEGITIPLLHIALIIVWFIVI